MQKGKNVFGDGRFRKVQNRQISPFRVRMSTYRINMFLNMRWIFHATRCF